MNKNEKIITTFIDKKLFELLEKDAKENKRPVSRHIQYIVENYIDTMIVKNIFKK